MKTHLCVLVVLILLAGCAGTLNEGTAQTCPASIPAPALEAGDVWYMQDEQGRNLYLRYIRRTEEGLLEREDRPKGARLFYDDTHTLRKVYQDGKWLSEATIDQPEIGKPRLVFPLVPGKTWSDQYLAKSTGGMIFSYDHTFTVRGCARITVPVGGFFAVAIEEYARNSMTNFGGVRTWWYSPEVKAFVKLTYNTPRGFWSPSNDWSLTSFRLASSPAPLSTGSVTAPPPPSPPPTAASEQSIPTSAPLPSWERGYEWKFRWTSPNGAGTFVWSVVREEVIAGVPHYVVRTGTREIYYTKAEFAWLMERVEGAVETRASSAECRFEWPLVVGKEWEQRYTWENLAERRTQERHRRYRVEAVESVTVPAGTFQAFHVRAADGSGNFVGEYWYSPEIKWIVKDRWTVSRGVQDRELLEYKLRATIAPLP